MLLLLLAGLTLVAGSWNGGLQRAWFDAHQRIMPRSVQTLPVTIVEIDQKSLAVFGQWPWPRDLLAKLVDAVQAARPAAIGLDILMPEDDALSPENLFARLATDPAVAVVMRGLSSNDAVLAQSLARSPSVMAFAGTPEPSPSVLRSVPIGLVAQRTAAAGDDAAPGVAQYAGALTSLDLLNSQAKGWGLISVDTSSGGVVRRMPLVANVHGTLVPSLALEMLRVAAGGAALRVRLDGSKVESVEVADLQLATEADGAVRVHFSRRRGDRFVSAVDVLQGRVEAGAFERQLVLIAPTAIGLHDFQSTPVGERMPGAEIHAQLIENLLGGQLLLRPAWLPWLEAGLVLVSGAMLLWITPRWRATRVALAVAAGVALPIAAGLALFRSHRLLFDSLSPGMALLALFFVLLVLTLTDTTRQRRALEQMVQTQRLKAARLDGELEAAQRIQTGSLPRLDLLAGDPRIELHAMLLPAREVGGDLYDFFRLDERRLFLLIGDVAGKGLSASIFMAVSKALYKGAMLRAPDADIGQIMSAANAEVSRDNAQALFVTAFAAILDLDSGELHCCNAGHDNPYWLPADGSGVRRIEDGDGPPLCALEDFDYLSASRRLAPGDLLCLMTDGVLEAQNAAGELYGSARVERLLATPEVRNGSVQALVAALDADVKAFEAGTEAADDLTLLVLRWQGPQSLQRT
ncbi:MAG: CHASE2 domain-containing protein [Burkholderiaceae bacterium]